MKKIERWFHSPGDLALLRVGNWWVCGVLMGRGANTKTVAWGDTYRTVPDEPTAYKGVSPRAMLDPAAGRFIGQRFSSLAAARRALGPYRRDC